MSYVSCRAFGPALAAMKQRGLATSLLTDGLAVSPEHIENPRNRVDWDVLVAVTARLEELFGGIEALENLYFEFFLWPEHMYVPKVARYLLTPSNLYWAGTRWIGPSLFPVIDGCFETLEDGRLRETLVIPDRYADSPQTFALMRGALRAAPSLFDLPPARVEMELRPRRCVFTITLPQARPSLRHRISAWFTDRHGRPLLDSLVEQQVELQENYDEIDAAQDQIAEQAKRLEETNWALQEQNEELERRVAERTASLAREIELHKQAAEELAHSRVQLRAAERLSAVGTLAAGIAHEINNPIAAILLAAQYSLRMRDDATAIAVQRDSMVDIEREAKRCATIVKSIMQFTREEPTAKWASNLNDIVHRVLLQVLPYAQIHNARVSETPWPESLYSELNPMQIEQALMNVIRNAIESSEIGVDVEVGLEEREGVARITVSDTGTGIADDIRSRVFDPFFTTRRHKGQTGLGLSVVHGILAEHEASIEIESKHGSGTRVAIELVLCRPPEN